MNIVGQHKAGVEIYGRDYISTIDLFVGDGGGKTSEKHHGKTDCVNFIACLSFLKN